MGTNFEVVQYGHEPGREANIWNDVLGQSISFKAGETPVYLLKLVSGIAKRAGCSSNAEYCE